MYHNLLICSLTDGHFGYFQFELLCIKLLETFVYESFHGYYIYIINICVYIIFSWAKALLLGHVTSVYLTLQGIAKLFSKIVLPFCTPANSESSTSSPTFSIALFLNFSHLMKCSRILLWF